MVEGNWGEKRLASRVAARKRRSLWLGAAIVMFAAGLPFMAGFVDGFRDAPKTSAPPWVDAVSLIGWIVVVALAMVWKWRDMDEVERGHALRAMATIGLVAFLYMPILMLAEPFITVPHPVTTGWLIAVAAGGIPYTVRRLIDWKRR
ncbi:hypothetical protein ASE75_11555 [Sphingomonas sp. Leaf17]|nr:hypothetical protein ASE75_11555 [Sphingomonas sp. Leaf17]